MSEFRKADFGAAYLRAEDVISDGKWGELTLKISAAHKPGTFRSEDGKEIDKDVLEFENYDQKMIIGKINWRLLRYATGIENKSQAVGKTITLHAVCGNWFGQKDVAAMRIRIPDGCKHPYLRLASLGTDITGLAFAGCPPAAASSAGQPAKKDAPQQVAATETPRALTELLLRWQMVRNVTENAQAWRLITAAVDEKIESSGWQASEDRDKLMGVILEIEKELKELEAVEAKA